MPGYRPTASSSSYSSSPYYHWQDVPNSNLRQLDYQQQQQQVQQVQKEEQHSNQREHVSSRLYPTLPSMNTDSSNLLTLPRIRDLAGYHFDKGNTAAINNPINSDTSVNSSGNLNYQYNQPYNHHTNYYYYNNADSWSETSNPSQVPTPVIGSSFGYQPVAPVTTSSSSSSTYTQCWESLLSTSSVYHAHGPSYSGIYRSLGVYFWCSFSYSHSTIKGLTEESGSPSTSSFPFLSSM
jgi:hypothetical protein